MRDFRYVGMHAIAGYWPADRDGQAAIGAIMHHAQGRSAAQRLHEVEFQFGEFLEDPVRQRPLQEPL